MAKKTTTKKKSKKKASSNVATQQPQLNIGMIGHVDHGKTSLTERLSGKWTDTHSEEVKRGITIRLGYADTIIYKDDEKKGTEQYSVQESKNTKAVRKISLVDAPGHESLMATMICGANIMDAALLLIAANESCPQPQTREHLTALEIIDVPQVIVIQNKIDLVSEEEAKKNYEQIKAFLKGTKYEDAPIIPMSTKYNINTDVLLQLIVETIPVPEPDPKADPVMLIARSFDVNKPGTEYGKLQGGILGGTLQRGTFSVGEEIEIKPGYKVEEKNQQVWKPLKTKIAGLATGKQPLDEARPGGSIGVMTLLDPSIVKSDSLAGNLAGYPGTLPDVRYKLQIETHLMERVVGTNVDQAVEPIKLGEPLMLNVNSTATVGVVTELGKNMFHCKLKLPVCADIDSRITVSRRIGTRFRLIGYGIIKDE